MDSRELLRKRSSFLSAALAALVLAAGCSQGEPEPAASPAATAPPAAAVAPKAAASPGALVPPAGDEEEPGIDEAIASLEAAQNDDDRIEWLTEIAWLGDAKGIPAAAALLDDAQSDDVVEEAVSTLEDLGGQASIDALARFLERTGKESSKVRTIEALFYLSDEGDAVKPLAQALDDSSAEVRRQAAMALGAIGDEASLAALRKRAAVETDENVKKAIEDAIAQAGGAEAAKVAKP